MVQAAANWKGLLCGCGQKSEFSKFMKNPMNLEKNNWESLIPKLNYKFVAGKVATGYCLGLLSP